MAAPQVKLKKLSAFQPQRENSNRHTARGLWMLDTAMAQDGYVAPMTAAADGEVIDGSARLEKAAERFPDDAIVVEHDGRRPIVMVRTDIPSADDPRAQRISAAANRIAQVNLDFDPVVLRGLDEDVRAHLWTEKEWTEIALPAVDFQDREDERAAEKGEKKATCPECGCQFLP